MKFGLSVNSNETVEEIVEKCVEIERLGFDYVWVADVPAQRYSPTVAAALAEKTSRLRIGLGLLSTFLHTPVQIASSLATLIEFYGDRFELCLGPGDKDGLQRVGIHLYEFKDIPGLILKAKEKIVATLHQNGFEVPVWLGAQGPRILRIAKSFHGVLLNYAQPDFIEWAIKEMHLPDKSSIQIGIYAPSYVYDKKDEEVYRLFRVSSAIVALGAPKSVLERFGFLDKMALARRGLKRGLPPEEILNEVPVEVVENFGICMRSEQLDVYLSRLKRSGIEHVVFGYPQNFSLNTIRDLARQLFE